MLNHTAISVTNLERSRNFYEQLLGLTLHAEAEVEELHVKIVLLKDGTGNFLELFQHNDPIALSEDLMDFQRVGVKHIAFVVEDLDNIITKALSLGSKVIWSPRSGDTFKRFAFVSDPDGMPFELVELR